MLFIFAAVVGGGIGLIVLWVCAVCSPGYNDYAKHSHGHLPTINPFDWFKSLVIIIVCLAGFHRG